MPELSTAVRALVDRSAPALADETREFVAYQVMAALQNLFAAGPKAALEVTAPLTGLSPELTQALQPVLVSLRLELLRALSGLLERASITLMAAVSCTLETVARAGQASHVNRLEDALRGIRSCATACPCCRMHQKIASGALRLIVTDSPSSGRSH